MKNLIISIEQGANFITHESPLPENVVGKDLPTFIANRALNVAMAWVTNQRILAAPKDKVRLNKPFTFSVTLESDGVDTDFQPFTTKIGLSDKYVNKMIANLPIVVKNMTYSMDTDARERFIAVHNNNAALPIELNKPLEVENQMPILQTNPQ